MGVLQNIVRLRAVNANNVNTCTCNSGSVFVSFVFLTYVITVEQLAFGNLDTRWTGVSEHVCTAATHWTPTVYIFVVD